MEQHSSTSLFNLSIDPLTKAHLSEASKWARFLAIVGMVALALMIVFGLFASTLISRGSNPFDGTSEPSTGVEAYMGIGMAVIYLVLALIWFFPLLYLLRFANRLKTALNSNDQTALNTGFQNLKACFRYVGIITIIVLALYILLFVLMLLGGAAASLF